MAFGTIHKWCESGPIADKGGGGPKTRKFCVTSFMDGPLYTDRKREETVKNHEKFSRRHMYMPQKVFDGTVEGKTYLLSSDLDSLNATSRSNSTPYVDIWVELVNVNCYSFWKLEDPCPTENRPHAPTPTAWRFTSKYKYCYNKPKIIHFNQLLDPHPHPKSDIKCLIKTRSL